MAQVKRSPILRFLDKLQSESVLDSATDGQLLRQYVQSKDDRAFSVLLRRHGDMVFRVCHRVLNHQADAEDAFQVTFLILAQRGSSIRRSSSLCSWLHGVALRTAKNLQRQKCKRTEKEAHQAKSSTVTDADVNDIWPILDKVIAELPERYRLPVIICYLEGRTNDEAAIELGCSRGTIAGRLSRARDLLRQRLQRHGVTLTGTLLTLMFGTQASQAAPSTMIVTSTCQSATAFSSEMLSGQAQWLLQKGLNQMTVTKICQATVMLLTLTLCMAGGILLAQSDKSKTPSARSENQETEDKTKPPAQTWKKVAELVGHDRRQEVRTVAFSPDGRFIASGGEDMKVILWDVKSGKKLSVTKAHKDEVVSIAFSPDGKRLVTGGWDNVVNVIDVPTGRILMRLKAHQDRVDGVAISPQGDLGASCGQDKAVNLWSMRTGAVQARFRKFKGDVQSVTFSPDGRNIAAGSERGVIRLFDTQTLGEVGQIITKSNDVRGLAFSPDGKFIASSGDKDQVTVWNVSTTKRILSMKGHTSKIWAIVYDPTGKTIASGSSDGSVRVWDVKGGKQAGLIKVGDKVTGLSFSPDGQTIATGTDGKITLWRRK